MRRSALSRLSVSWALSWLFQKAPSWVWASTALSSSARLAQSKTVHGGGDALLDVAQLGDGVLKGGGHGGVLGKWPASDRRRQSAAASPASEKTPNSRASQSPCRV